MRSTSTAATRQIPPAAIQAGVYVESCVRTIPASSAPAAAPIWCDATTQPKAIGPSSTPNASVVSRTVGGTVAALVLTLAFYDYQRWRFADSGTTAGGAPPAPG